MSEETAFLQAILDDPNDLQLRMVFADWLEERGDRRGKLLRLTHTLTQSVDVPGVRNSKHACNTWWMKVCQRLGVLDQLCRRTLRLDSTGHLFDGQSGN